MNIAMEILFAKAASKGIYPSIGIDEVLKSSYGRDEDGIAYFPYWDECFPTSEEGYPFSDWPSHTIPF